MTSQNLSAEEKEIVSLAKEEIGYDPILKGYRLLVRAPIIKEQTSCGLILSDDYKLDTAKDAAIGKLLSVGPISFVDKKASHYKTGIGKWILYSKQYREKTYSLINGVICYYLNDDSIHSELKDEDAQAILDKLRGY